MHNHHNHHVFNVERVRTRETSSYVQGTDTRVHMRLIFAAHIPPARRQQSRAHGHLHFAGALEDGLGLAQRLEPPDELGPPRVDAVLPLEPRPAVHSCPGSPDEPLQPEAGAPGPARFGPRRRHLAPPLPLDLRRPADREALKNEHTCNNSNSSSSSSSSSKTRQHVPARFHSQWGSRTMVLRFFCATKCTRLCFARVQSYISSAVSTAQHNGISPGAPSSPGRSSGWPPLPRPGGSQPDVRGSRGRSAGSVTTPTAGPRT